MSASLKLTGRRACNSVQTIAPLRLTGALSLDQAKSSFRASELGHHRLTLSGLWVPRLHIDETLATVKLPVDVSSQAEISGSVLQALCVLSLETDWDPEPLSA